MKAAARRLLDQFEADSEKINPLERPYDASADVIPLTWTPEHCSKRIVEAFETLAKTPGLRGPKAPGGCWPPYTYDWEDKLAQATLSDTEQRQRAREQNRTIVRATGVELRHMDCVLDWLRDLHAVNPTLCIVVQQWAVLRASGQSVKEACRERGVRFQTFYRAKAKGVEIIVARLNTGPAQVF